MECPEWHEANHAIRDIAFFPQEVSNGPSQARPDGSRMENSGYRFRWVWRRLDAAPSRNPARRSDTAGICGTDYVAGRASAADVGIGPGRRGDGPNHPRLGFARQQAIQEDRLELLLGGAGTHAGVCRLEGCSLAGTRFDAPCHGKRHIEG
jgi:hypothetical protein